MIRALGRDNPCWERFENMVSSQLRRTEIKTLVCSFSIVQHHPHFFLFQDLNESRRLIAFGKYLTHYVKFKILCLQRGKQNYQNDSDLFYVNWIEAETRQLKKYLSRYKRVTNSIIQHFRDRKVCC